MRLRLRLPAHEQRRLARHRRPDIPPSAPCVFDRGDEVLRGAVLRQIAERARAERASRELRRRMHADDQQRQRRMLAAQLLDQVEAARTGQRDVEQHDIPFGAVRPRASRTGRRPLRRRRHRETGRVRIDRMPWRTTGWSSTRRIRIIVCAALSAFRRARASTACLSWHGSGTRTVTTVPLPGMPAISSAAPACVARSRMPSSPIDSRRRDFRVA